MSASEKQVAKLIRKGWVPVDGDNALLINARLFKIGFISLLSPDQCTAPLVEENKPFAISEKRSVVAAYNDKDSRKAKQYFNLPHDTVSLINDKRRGECYVPVMVANEQGKAAAALYIHPRKLGPENTQAGLAPFTAFHAETCLLGAQLNCRSNGIIRHFTKHHVTFLEGEYIDAITSTPGENSYEMMQLKELEIMAMLMASHSLKGPDGKPQAQVTHHLPWLDYILSSVLLWRQGYMSYHALFTLCEIMISKKIEHEHKIAHIYGSLGLAFRFITPFDNLLNPTKPITAESVLEQLGIDERESPSINPQLDTITGLLELLKSESGPFVLSATALDSSILQKLADDVKTKKQEKLKAREGEFVNQYLSLLTANTFDLEQKNWWEKAIASGKQIETIDELLEVANVLALAIAANPASGDTERVNACSFVSTQARQIQVVYERLYKLGAMSLPPVTCWTSLPLFLTHSQSTCGATFYFEYAPHAAAISRLIERNIVGGAISNMVAYAQGQKGTSVKGYLETHQYVPCYSFFRPISGPEAPEITMPGVKTLPSPISGFIINGLGTYDHGRADEIITFGARDDDQHTPYGAFYDPPSHHAFLIFGNKPMAPRLLELSLTFSGVNSTGTTQDFGYNNSRDRFFEPDGQITPELSDQFRYIPDPLKLQSLKKSSDVKFSWYGFFSGRDYQDELTNYSLSSEHDGKWWRCG